MKKDKVAVLLDKSEKLLEEIHQFLDKCELDENVLSDTWRKTLDVKGSRYTLGEMHRMRRPGSNVSLQIVSFHQLSDAQALDLDNPIQRTLLEMGDSEIGEPVLDLNVLGVNISSHYVNSIVTASKIIAHLDSIGISEPTILEIGSGIGLLGVALKKWYGSKATLIFADLPETLEHQSFLLLSTFPNEKYSFKPSDTNVDPVTGGINFVNTYKLMSQNYPVDVFINCNSMAEMKAETANSYIGYAKNNLNPKGIMYLSNAFGMATSSARTPAEYSLGDGWYLEEVSFSDGYIYGGPTLVFMNSILSRSAISSENDLKLVQREAYNKHVFLMGLEKSIEGPSNRDALKLLSTRQVLALETTQIEQLSRSSNRGLGWPQVGGIAIRRFQIAVSSAMKVSSKKSHGESRKFLDEAISDFSELFQSKRAYYSEFHNLFLSAALTGLNRNHQASSWIKDHYQETTSPYWLARYAWLANECENKNLSRKILDHIDLSALSRTWLPMIANLRFALGQRDVANQLLSDITEFEASDLTLDELEVLFKSNCLFGNYEESLRLFETIKLLLFNGETVDTDALKHRILELISFGIKNLGDEDNYFARQFDFLKPNLTNSVSQMKLLKQLNRSDESVVIGKSLEIAFSEDYFLQAKLAENFLYIGDNLSAQRCAAKSELLRPDNAKHLKYLGTVFFAFGYFDIAGKYFSKVVKNCGEDFVARGYESFCELSAKDKDSGFFGSAVTLPLIFQPDQTFYYPFGPRPR